MINKNSFILHQRLGHSATIPQPQCPICPLAKQARITFPHSTTTTSQPFAFIHLDIWGPYYTPNHDGSIFFLTIDDDFSLGTWTFLMQSKTQTLTHIKNFFSMVTTQFHTLVQRVRTDNASEFFNHSCSSLFLSLGILHESSCTYYTPQQNGVVERKHRHLLEVA